MHIIPYFFAAFLVFWIEDVQASRMKRFLLDMIGTTQVVDTGPYQWSKWSSWSYCNGTCNKNGGHGQMHRTRRCKDGDSTVAVHFCQEPYTGDDDEPTLDAVDTVYFPDIKNGDLARVNSVDAVIYPDIAEDGSVQMDYHYQTCMAEGCIINIWAQWSSWSNCSVPCGNGSMSRTRECTSGSDCVGQMLEYSRCTQSPCPIDGGWGRWTEFGECSSSCGNGVQFRLRQCNNPAPQYGGNDCIGSSQEFRACTKGLCSIDGGWSNFTSMACSATCGIGVQTSFRTCTNPSPANGGKNCTGESYKFAHCKIIDCIVDGGWTNWGDWSACPVTSGIGQQIRIRNCTNPEPAHGGRDCDGDEKETKYCVVNKWSGWSVWSNCSATCGDGTKNRTRTCISGKDCVGESTENTSCTMPRCLNVVDGSWGVWSNWSDCINTCGNGTQTRTRQCDSPAPQDGGSNCTGTNVETTTCSLDPCPIDGGWSAFQDLACSVTCGKGTFVSVRACNNPVPQYGGKNCIGLLHEIHECTLSPCPIEGIWGSWSNWTDCSNTCGNGTQTRTRLCDNPAPQNGGQPCSGNAVETQACSIKECPIDGGWSHFRTVPCSVTCGRGQQIALRTCDNPAPAFGGRSCDGLSHQISECEMPSCVIDGSWSDWSITTNCSSFCGDGYVLRSRTCSNPTPENGGKNCTGSSEERLDCNSGPCPADVPTCDKMAVLESLKYHALFAPTRAGPCSNMDYIPEEKMLISMCKAPTDSRFWKNSIDVRTNCARIPLYTPIVKVHRQYSTRNYGILLSCYQSKLKIATETCEDGVHEQEIYLDIESGWDYYSMKW